MDTVHVHIPYPKIGTYLPLIKQNNFNLEIYFPAEALDSLSSDDIKSLKKDIAPETSLSFHAPFMDLAPGALDSGIRAVTIERFSRTLDIAEVFLPKVIVFHSGYEKWRYAHKVDIWLEQSLDTWRPLIKRAASLGLKLAIENIFEDEPSNLEMLMKELHRQNFGICFDTGHCNLFSNVPLSRWIESLSPYIFEFHIHDNDKTRDLHLPIGDGTFDFDALFADVRIRNRDYIYTLEAHTPERVMKSLGRLKELFSRL